MPDTDPSSSASPEVRKKPTAVDKFVIFTGRKVVEGVCRVVLGKDQFPEIVKGLCEDAVLAPRLCSPDESKKHLTYEHAHAGQWISHDFRRAEFYPLSAKNEWYEDHKEGIVSAMLIDGIEDKDENERTDLPIAEYLTVDNILSFDKPGIEKLLSLGMVARRSHELAYEIAGQEEWIDELRSRGVANDPVYQVTPKAHSLIHISEESGKKTPKANPKLQIARFPVPGVLAH